MEINYRLKEAATWTLIADIMRRHESTAGLRVIETHPGDGQYDCRTIIQPTDDDFGPDIHFNLQSGNATQFGKFGPRRPLEYPEWAGKNPEKLAYVEAVLQADHRMQVVNHLEAMLGLPHIKKSPATSAHALCYRLMAEVASRTIFDGPVVRWKNGREDTSGYPPDDPIRPALQLVPEIARSLTEPPSSRNPADAPGYKYWIWTTRKKLHESGTAVAIVDALEGTLYWIDAPSDPIRLMAKYDEVGRNVQKLVNSLHRP